MDKKEYSQLRLKERIEIYRLHADGKSRRFIAKHLKRSPSTISRELRRNGKPSRRGWPGGYDPERAQALTQRRHARGRAHKLVRQPELRKQVQDQLAMGRSPEQIAGRLALEQGKAVISHESIYRYIYWRAYSFRGGDANLYRLLPSQRRQRRRRSARKRGGMPAIPNRTPLDKRPHGAQNRSRFGHWEADMMSFSTRTDAVLVLCDTRSRYVCMQRRDNKKSADVLAGLNAIFDTLPTHRRKTVTFDNGQEFRRHDDLARTHNLKTFFCDVQAPWQKGTVENTIGRIRRFLPRKTDPEHIAPEDLEKIVRRVNNTPRKCLKFKTPHEAFFNQRVALQT